MKTIATIILFGLGVGYTGVLVWELLAGHGTIMMEAHPTSEPMDHWTFLVLLSWCLASIYAAYHLWDQED